MQWWRMEVVSLATAAVDAHLSLEGPVMENMFKEESNIPEPGDCNNARSTDGRTGKMGNWG